MNERVQALVEQAKQSVPAGLEPEQWLEVYHAKFAELIVRECIAQCNDGDSRWFIAQHFGIEE
jgi:hypothetical protein